MKEDDLKVALEEDFGDTGCLRVRELTRFCHKYELFSQSRTSDLSKDKNIGFEYHDNSMT